MSRKTAQRFCDNDTQNKKLERDTRIRLDAARIRIGRSQFSDCPKTGAKVHID